MRLVLIDSNAKISPPKLTFLEGQAMNNQPETAEYWRELLGKYMEHVSCCEGITFVGRANVGKSGSHGEGDSTFTEQDIERLTEIAKTITSYDT